MSEDKKRLISLSEHNAKRLEHYERTMRKVGNGIACPKCNAELYDTKEAESLLSYPPQKNVFCENCSYRGLRFV